MNYRFFVFVFILILRAMPASAFELNKPQREERCLTIELEASEAPTQRDFDKYVRELAAAAQRDVKTRESQQQEDALKNQQAKTLNPIVIFRW